MVRSALFSSSVLAVQIKSQSTGQMGNHYNWERRDMPLPSDPRQKAYWLKVISPSLRLISGGQIFKSRGMYLLSARGQTMGLATEADLPEEQMGSQVFPSLLCMNVREASIFFLMYG